MGYYTMAKKFHPDLNADVQGAEYEKLNIQFQKINNAYQLLSDITVKRRYDEMSGNIQAAEDQPSQPSPGGIYESVIKKKQQESPEPEEQTFDLDEELAKLEQIKKLRQQDFNDHREKINKAKMEQLTKIYFQNEMRIM